MQMNRGEIIRSYKSAKNPKSQIGILADLNCCTKEEIEKIVLQNDDNVENNQKCTKDATGISEWLYQEMDKIENDIGNLQLQIKELEKKYNECAAAIKKVSEFQRRKKVI